MADILYLVHRMPYPPDKGDKVRSYHLLKHLVQRHRVHLGTFVDDPADLAHLPALRAMCADVFAVRQRPTLAKLASLRGLLAGEALTLPCYRSAALERWVRSKAGQVDAALLFSSCMAQYVRNWPESQVLLDLVDVDSAKWSEYAPRHRWPLSWLYRRESGLLLSWERHCAAQARRTWLASEKEAELFRRLAPESAGRIAGMSNGVDAEMFSPDPGRPSPFGAGERALVFTGAMDYWPNVDAVTWFAAEALPALRERHPGLRLYVVGRNPAPAVQALAGAAVVVTGTVPDVRPYLQHAAVVVAPLRLARGIQNKVLEAMAMGQAVVAADACVSALAGVAPGEIVAASSAADYVDAVSALLADPVRAQAIGRAARQRVWTSFGWSAHLRQLDEHLPASRSVPSAPASSAALAAQGAAP